MAHTEDLLQLANEFSQVFADPEAANEWMAENNLFTQNSSSTTEAKTEQLLQLIAEFPQAFADPEEPHVSQPEQSSMPLDSTSSATPESVPVAANYGSLLQDIPPGYAYALRRRMHTLTWGQVDFHLVYGENGLEEIWLTVGKSGTEVQSLGEATCRLINLLLSSGVSIPKIVREIRGIRGADSEGLGPNRFLGLADLIGKVLQEAPEQYGTAQIASHSERRTTDNSASSLPQVESISTSSPQPTVLEESAARSWSHESGVSSSQIFSSTETAASTLCPECGTELQQVNGCKGGACIVCGYSSCS